MVQVKEITFDALRWMEEPVRIKIFPDGDHPRGYFQITSPREVEGLCQGRPVEELPRILSILSPAHHLASALALDKLFGVEPPPLAVTMREALLQTLFFENHLRKIYFLVSSRFDPLSSSILPGNGTQGFPPSPHILDEIMSHISIAREAVTLLGGRSDHPLSAVAGGVSRYLKEENYERLSHIYESCLGFSLRLGEFLRQEILGKDQALSDLGAFSMAPMSFMTLSEAKDTVILRGGLGQELDRFTPDRIFQKIGLHRESWSYEPFAYIQNRSGGPELKDQVGLQAIFHDRCFFVGPLARLNQDTALTPLAEEERQRLLRDRGPLPRFDLSSAFWSLFLELLQAAEKMAELYKKENLTGPEIRNIPTEMGREGQAALESPKGLIYHHYRVDKKGLVTDIAVLDTVTENNALRCLLTQNTAEIALTKKQTTQEMKNFLELVLLPF
jgi:F420-non-reducing hydrogenase large subunit